jgi:hypothetical protein
MEKSMTDTVVDKLLKQAIEVNKKLIIDHTEQVGLLHNQITILDKENAMYLAEYQKHCKHTDSITHQTHYMSGGYDHVSETQYEDRCVRCNIVTGSELVRGTYA